jgi:SulP family sulfate permease
MQEKTLPDMGLTTEEKRDWPNEMASRAPAIERPARRVRQRASTLLADWQEIIRIARLFPEPAGAAARRSLLLRWKGDICGGIVAGLMALPYGMALSVAIGLGPEAGLYTSIIGGLVSGLLSSSPILISGLSATAVPILAAVNKTHGVGAVLVVGFLSGLIMTVTGLLRLGRFANYLPPAIVSAFTSGLGLTIAVSQLKPMLGVAPVKAGFDLGIVDDIYEVVRALGTLNPQALAVASVVVVCMTLLPRVKETVPSSLVGIALAAIVARLGGFAEQQRTAALADSFPALRLPGFPLSQLSSLIHPSLMLAGLFIINQALTGIVVDRAQGNAGRGHSGNRELAAQGVANLVTPFFGALPGVAMLARTIASARAGATSRLSIIIHSLTLLLLVIPLRGLIGQIPLAALAAVTVMVGLQLIDWTKLCDLKRMNRADVVLFVLTFALVVFSDLVVGVGIGFLVALILFIERAAESTQLKAVRHMPAPGSELAGTQTFRLIGPLFFASGEKALDQLRRETTADLVILDLEAVGPVDATAADFLKRVFRMQQSRGGDLFLTGLDERLYAICARAGLVAEMGDARFGPNPAVKSFAANGHSRPIIDKDRRHRQ